ncbi:uncharacterized protein [Triticum aestivum]|uniref:uncharacterized protein isoform X2 n=1 Tax=Triticum aestivum TaxID=4565 RepID=UPI001D0113D3|nr:uncharacterized protein LOC123053896 isoform X2 [Triticum aestivum]
MRGRRVGWGIWASSAAICHRRRPRQPARQDPDPRSSSASVVKEEQRRTLGGPVAGAAEEPRRPPVGPVVGAAEEPRRAPGGPDQKPWPLVRVCYSCRWCVCAVPAASECGLFLLWGKARWGDGERAFALLGAMLSVRAGAPLVPN